MTVLCNTQDGHLDIGLKEMSSLKGQLVDTKGIEPSTLRMRTVRSPMREENSGQSYEK